MKQETSETWGITESPIQLESNLEIARARWDRPRYFIGQRVEKKFVRIAEITAKHHIFQRPQLIQYLMECNGAKKIDLKGFPLQFPLFRFLMPPLAGMFWGTNVILDKMDN